MIPAIVAVCLIPVFMVCLLVLAVGLLVQVGEVGRALLRRWRARRWERQLEECARILQQSNAKLAAYSDLSRFVTANMLLSEHRRQTRGVEARA